MLRLGLATSLLVFTPGESRAQQGAPSVKAFFEQRLSAKADAIPPSHDQLLGVIDAIARIEPGEVQSSVPLIRTALRSRANNLPTEALLALFQIAQRPDGPALLSDSIPDLASLLANPDERLSGGSVTVLRHLTRSVPSKTVQFLVNELRALTPPSLVKAEIVRILLESSARSDLSVLSAVDEYLSMPSEQRVRIANLQALQVSRVATRGAQRFALDSLSDSNKHVQIAAIQAVYALGSETQAQGRSALSRLAAAASTDREVRSMAEKALQNRLDDP